MQIIPEKCWICQKYLLNLTSTAYCPDKFKKLESISYEASHFLVAKMNTDNKYYMFIDPYWVQWEQGLLEIEHDTQDDDAQDFDTSTICAVSNISFETFKSLKHLEAIQNFLLLQ